MIEVYSVEEWSNQDEAYELVCLAKTPEEAEHYIDNEVKKSPPSFKMVREDFRVRTWTV